jgi:hypothetical protein
MKRLEKIDREFKGKLNGLSHNINKQGGAD